MKQSMLLMAGLAMALASCQKDESISQGPSNESGSISRTSSNTIKATLPGNFTRKVLAEEFTGSTYGDAPMSNETLDYLTRNNPNTIYVASFHDADMLETPATDQLKAALPGGPSAGFPSASINRNDLSGSRFITFGDYENMTGMCMQQSAKCGLALSSAVNGRTASITVMAGFNEAMTGDYSMNVYLVESNVMDKDGSLAQANNFNASKITSFYNMGNPISGYVHQNVVRRMITPLTGMPISASKLVPGGIATERFSIDLPLNAEIGNCSIIAFVTKVTNGVADNICNVQMSPLGSVKTWD